MKVIDGPTGREMAGDDIPYHLRDNADPLGRCDACGRKTWAPEVGKACGMPSPTGGVCRGTFRSIALDPAPCVSAGVTDPTLRDSLRGGGGIAPAAHPTPSREQVAAQILAAAADAARGAGVPPGHTQADGAPHRIREIPSAPPRSS